MCKKFFFKKGRGETMFTFYPTTAFINSLIHLSGVDYTTCPFLCALVLMKRFFETIVSKLIQSFHHSE